MADPNDILTRVRAAVEAREPESMQQILGTAESIIGMVDLHADRDEGLLALSLASATITAQRAEEIAANAPRIIVPGLLQ